MEYLTGIFAILSPFLAAYLTYVFTVKKTKNDINIEKGKVLNKVLSDMLSARFYMTRIRIVDSLLTNPSPPTIFPIDKIPLILLNSELLVEADFSELDISINLLKEHDALIHYRLKDLGKNFELINNSYLFPVIEVLGQKEKSINPSPIRTIVDKTIAEIEENLINISQLLGKKVVKQVKEILNLSDSDLLDEMISELEDSYYKAISPLIKNGEPVSKKEFKDYLSTEEFKEILKDQIKATHKGGLKSLFSSIEDTKIT